MWPVVPARGCRKVGVFRPFKHTLTIADEGRQSGFLRFAKLFPFSPGQQKAGRKTMRPAFSFSWFEL
jgi:hypothetical protein